jgi:hypothetical protein
MNFGGTTQENAESSLDATPKALEFCSRVSRRAVPDRPSRSARYIKRDEGAAAWKLSCPHGGCLGEVCVRLAVVAVAAVAGDRPVYSDEVVLHIPQIGICTVAEDQLVSCVVFLLHHGGKSF